MYNLYIYIIYISIYYVLHIDICNICNIYIYIYVIYIYIYIYMHIYITKHMKFELDQFLNFRETSYFQTISNRQKTKFGINLHNLKHLINAARNAISGNEGEL